MHLVGVFIAEATDPFTVLLAVAGRHTVPAMVACPRRFSIAMLERAAIRPDEFQASASDLFKGMQSGGRAGFHKSRRSTGSI
jgi:hypothetical protein